MLNLAATKSRAPDGYKSSLLRAIGTGEHGRGESNDNATLKGLWKGLKSSLDLCLVRNLPLRLQLWW